MDSDGLPLIGAGIDFSKVDPVPPKRSLACINHFIMHTVSFLNRFSCACEEKLEDLTVRIQRLETTMNLLESKLTSIPGLNDVTVAKSTQSQIQSNAVAAPQNELTQDGMTSPPSNINSNANVNGVAQPVSDPSTVGKDDSDAQGTTSAVNDPRYAKFFTLLKHGVPKEALAPKMRLEGLDPAILDNPSAPVASSASVPSKSRTTEENDSDFSDSDKKSDSLSEDSSSDDDLSD